MLWRPDSLLELPGTLETSALRSLRKSLGMDEWVFSLAQDLVVSEFQFIKLAFSGLLKRYTRPV